MSIDDPGEKSEYENLMEAVASGHAELLGEHHPTAAINVLQLYRKEDLDDPLGHSFWIVFKDPVDGREEVAGYQDGEDGEEKARLLLRAIAAAADLEVIARRASDDLICYGSIDSLGSLVHDLEAAVETAWNALNAAVPEKGGEALG